MSDDQEVKDKLSELENKLDAIHAALSDQFGSADGITYAAQQAWNALIRVEQLATKIENNTGSIYIAIWVLVAAVIANVVHHW